MKVKGLLLFILLPVLLWPQSYDSSPEESIALSYVFGAPMARKIMDSAVLTGKTFDDRPSQYLTQSDRIEVSKKFKKAVRSRLILVHEGAHMFQYKALYRDMKNAMGAKADSYYVWIEYLGQKLNIEAEAEVCRQLAAWYLDGIKLVDFPECIVRSETGFLGFARDSIDNRNKLWMYCEKYMALQRPIYWAEGAPEW